jgi:hypothetical protein
VPGAPSVVTGPNCCAPELVKLTASPVTGLPFASVTVAVAVDAAVPFALMVAGLNWTLTLLAVPAVWVNVAVPETLGLADLSVAVIVACPAVVVDVIVAW